MKTAGTPTTTRLLYYVPCQKQVRQHGNTEKEQPDQGWLRTFSKTTMNKISRKKLKTWLRKSLANHPENDNGLVAYVEAIVGDAEGTVRFYSRDSIVSVRYLRINAVASVQPLG